MEKSTEKEPPAGSSPEQSTPETDAAEPKSLKERALKPKGPEDFAVEGYKSMPDKKQGKEEAKKDKKGDNKPATIDWSEDSGEPKRLGRPS